MKFNYPQRGASFLSIDSIVGAPFIVLFLLFTILGIYYPTIFGQLNSVDDLSRTKTLLNQQHFDFLRLFFQGHGHYYFRPLVSSSFYLDRIFFSCRPEIMHFENVVIHCLNVLLVFFAAGKLLEKNDKQKDGILPLIVALFFGLHPLCTEPVNWISGRYDLLATFFVLLSFNILIRNTEHFRWWKDIIAAFSLLLGLLSKEVAAGLLICTVLGLLWDGSPLFVSEWRNRVKRCIPVVGAFFVYLWMRCGFQIASDNGFTSAIKGAHTAVGVSYWLKLKGMTTALGFYIKKLVWPFPLNFAIVDINRTVYFSLGVVGLGILVWMLLRKRGRVRFFMLWSIVFVFPALVVAVNLMAWTPLAERYLYTSLVGVSLAVGILLNESGKKGKGLLLALGCLILFFGWQTALRNIVWQNNITLFADVVKKSPMFAPGHNEYGIALQAAGRIEEAKQQYELASKLSGASPFHALATVNAAGLDSGAGLEKAIEKNLMTKHLSRKRRIEFLKKLAKSFEKQLLEVSDNPEKRKLLNKSIVIRQKLYRITRDPFHLYREGQLHLALREKEQARSCFEKVCKHSHDYYTKPACKLSQKLLEDQ